jgi:hypothetical protein
MNSEGQVGLTHADFMFCGLGRTRWTHPCRFSVLWTWKDKLDSPVQILCSVNLEGQVGLTHAVFLFCGLGRTSWTHPCRFSVLWTWKDKLDSPVQILQHSEESSLLEHLTGHTLLEQFVLPPCGNREGQGLDSCHRSYKWVYP